jgi:hypothetical protein
MPANRSPFDLNHLNLREHPWSPDDLARLGRVIATLRQSWEDANAVLATLVNVALRKRQASVFLPSNVPPPDLTFEAACSRLARAVRLVEEFAPTQPGWGWLVSGRILFNPDRPDHLDSLLRLIDPGPGNEEMPRLSANADVLRAQILAPHLAHTELVRAELAKLARLAAKLRAKPLTATDENILKQVERKPLKSQAIANRIGLSWDYTRHLCSKLVKAGHLIKTAEGYRKSL